MLITQRTVISEKRVKKLGLQVSPITNEVKPVGGKLTESKVTTPVEKETLEIETNLALAIVQSCFTDVLLGAVWLIVNDACTWLNR